MKVRAALILALVVAVVLLTPPVAGAQPAGKVYTIGILAVGPWAAIEGLRDGLNELGYEQGKKVRFESRWAGRDERLPSAAAELVHLNVDVIVTQGTPATVAAKRATTTIPIVMAGGSDPVGAGIVTNLARPGGNVTGVTSINVELNAKRLELLKETIPRLSRVAVLAPAGSPTAPLSLGVAERAARSLGIQLQVLAVRDHGDFDSAFAAATREHAGALTMFSSALFLGVSNSQRLADLAVKHRLPTVSPYRVFADAGGLMAYGVNNAALSHHAATYVDKILKGANPGDLPIEQPTKFELVINLKTAKALGLTIPPSLLLRADHVIE